MFWAVVLPFQITVVVMGALVIALTCLAPPIGRKSGRTFIMTMAIALIALVPSCIGIEFLVDTQRFGLAHYPTHQAIWNFHAPESIPKAATEITIDKFASGHRARFKISKIDLERWLDEIWTEYGKNSTIKREDRDYRTFKNAADFPAEFRVYEWKPAAETIRYGGPVSARGSGFEVWYSLAEEMAHQRCSYW